MEEKQLKGKYDDILYMSHPVSKRHRQMSRIERAAQFSPFAALTGYEAVVKEAARMTENKRELDEEERRKLDNIIHFLQSRGSEKLEVSIRYFEPDDRKEGGSYREVEGCVKVFDYNKRSLVLEDGFEISVEMIDDIWSEAISEQFGD